MTDKQLREAVDDGWPIIEIAETYGLSRFVVARRMRALQLNGWSKADAGRFTASRRQFAAVTA